MSFTLTAAVFAQRGGSADPELRRNRNSRPQTETVTISGSMIVAHGFPAIKSGDITYIIGGINRLVGFVDGIKEGAQVTIDGMAVSIQRDGNLKFLRPSKLTLSGKTYDLALPGQGLRNFGQGMTPPRWNNQVPPGNNNRQPPAPPPPQRNPRERQAPNMRQHRNYL